MKYCSLTRKECGDRKVLLDRCYRSASIFFVRGGEGRKKNNYFPIYDEKNLIINKYKIDQNRYNLGNAHGSSRVDDKQQTEESQSKCSTHVV